MTSEHEEHVRRVLGSLPPEGPVPPDVAARLDARLADLVAQRAAEASPERAAEDPAERAAAVSAEGQTDELAARRRRRRVTTGLVAAASVAVIGVGLGTVAGLTGGLSGADSGRSESAVSDSAAGGAAEEPAPAAERREGAVPEMAPEMAPEVAPGDASLAGPLLLTGSRTAVSSATLDRDVARLAGRVAPRTAREDATADRVRPLDEGRGPDALAPCVVPAADPGDLVAPVRLDGDPATLILSPTTDGTREARIYSCDDGDALLATTTVPAP